MFRLGGWSPLIHTQFLVLSATWDIKIRSRYISSTGLSPSSAWLPIQFVYASVPDWLSYGSPILFPLPHICNARMLDTNVFWPIVRFRSPLLTLSLRFLFLRVLRCFTSPGSPPFRDEVFTDSGLPHSGIHVFAVICTLTWLFAACHALLR